MINIQLTVEETNVILTALLDLPAKQSMKLIQSIQAQAQEQLAAQNAPEPEPTPISKNAKKG